MKNILKYFSILLILAFFFCKCDKPDPKPDPCIGKAPTTADFWMYEDNQSREIYKNKNLRYDTDTGISYYATFVAKDSLCTSYRWEIGAGVYTTTSVFISFDKIEPNVPVKLTVTKKADTLCFPSDKGSATASRVYHTVENSLFRNAKFFGYLNGNTKDTVTIYFKMLTYEEKLLEKRLEIEKTIYIFDRIINLKRGDTSYFIGTNGRPFFYRLYPPVYLGFNFYGDNKSFNLSVPTNNRGLFIQKNDSLKFDYLYYEMPRKIAQPKDIIKSPHDTIHFKGKLIRN